MFDLNPHTAYVNSSMHVSGYNFVTDAKIPRARAQDPGKGLETYGTLKHVCVKAPVLVYKGAGLGRLWDAALGCCRKKWCLIFTESLSGWESSEHGFDFPLPHLPFLFCEARRLGCVVLGELSRPDL